jgi:hypothetical protein
MEPCNPLFNDMNYDFMIDMRDTGIAASTLGAYPDHPRWNLHCDLNEDSKIDITDLLLIAKNFGVH